jgi:membrane-associated phospholipid phosphatase
MRLVICTDVETTEMAAGRVALVAGVAFLALAALVALGAVQGVDRWVADEWMPWRVPPRATLVDLTTVFVPETRWTLGGTVVSLLTYPASPFVSGLIVLACAWVLRRRGDARAAIAVCCLWLAANVVEVTGKLLDARDPIRGGFRHSYPSGHTVRACVLAAAIVLVWRRAGLAVVPWAVVGVPLALVLIGDHTASDVAGGLLLAACLVGATMHALAVSRGERSRSR